MRNLVRINPSQNGKLTLSFIDIGKSCLSHEIFTSLIRLLMLFVKMKFSRKFPNQILQFTVDHRVKYFVSNQKAETISA